METSDIMNVVLALVGGVPAPLIEQGLATIDNDMVKGNAGVLAGLIGLLLFGALGYFTESELLQTASFGAAGEFGAELVRRFVKPMLGGVA